MIADLLQRHGARRAGPSRPARSSANGSTNVRAARDNELLAVGCAYGYGGEGELDGADAMVAPPADLPAAIRRLLSMR